MRRRFEREAVPLLGRVLRVAMKFTGNIVEAEDLVQDTYVRALERFGQYKPGTNLMAWLSRIAYTQFVNGFYKKKLRGAYSLNEALDSPKEPEFRPAPALVEEFAKVTLAPRVREWMDENVAKALDRLSGDLRDVLILCVVGELKYCEAAGTLKIPVGTVMSRLSRARLAMPEELLRLLPSDELSLPEDSIVEAGERK